MFELIAFFGLLGVAAVVLLAFACVWLALKLVFKIALLPFTLAFGLLKAVLIGVGILLAVVLGPVLLAVGFAVILPLAILALMVWGGVALVGSIA